MKTEKACEYRYAPVANALGICRCGEPIGDHEMVPLAEWSEVERQAAGRDTQPNEPRVGLDRLREAAAREIERMQNMWPPPPREYPARAMGIVAGTRPPWYVRLRRWLRQWVLF